MPTPYYSPSIAIAANKMRCGEVIAYPTEAVWGLGCDPHNEKAVNTILALKQRHVAKGLILVAASVSQFAPYLQHLSQEQRATLDHSWPGPFTWLVPHHDTLPPWIYGDFPSVALRVSAHPTVHQLCNAFGGPIVSTSANPQGKPAPREAWQVHRYFHHSPLLTAVVKGQVGNSLQPSTITDLASGRVIRG
jgi:L-threonylcarbamoyladenylate synthase